MAMKNLYRVATSEEIRRYQETLYPLQDTILSLLPTFDDFYLTGGTALARFYLHHRVSEDLDLFINVRKEDDLQTNRQKKRADIYAQDLVSLLSRTYEISDDVYDFYYSRFYVKTKDCTMKIDVVREHLHYGELVKTSDGFYLNNLEDIAATKIAAFEDRAEMKDIIDLWYLTKRIPFSKLFELADLKRVPVAYEQLLTINTQGISGMALLTKPIDEQELTMFLDVLKKETENEIKKKEHLTMNEIEKIIAMNLWDFPREFRNLNPHSIPVLKRRLHKLPLPKRNVLERLLS
jgi:hypothetical protein